VRLGRSALRFSDPTDELLKAFEGGTDESASIASARSSAPPNRALSSPVPGAVAEITGSNPVGRSPSDPAAAVMAPGASATASPIAPIAPLAPGSTSPGAATGQPTTGRPLIDRRRKPKSRAADWVVVAFAVIILGVSMAALYFLLHGSPAPTPH
jgi:hypothetical protein